MKRETDPMTEKKDVKNSTDNKIDEDFKGFPNGQAKESIINPKTAVEKITAALYITDGEKVNKNPEELVDESESDGSGGAFEGTENMRDDE